MSYGEEDTCMCLPENCVESQDVTQDCTRDTILLRYEPLHPDPSLATPEVQIYTSSRHTGKCMLVSAVHGRLTLLY
jgi:hypothetical protein